MGSHKHNHSSEWAWGNCHHFPAHLHWHYSICGNPAEFLLIPCHPHIGGFKMSVHTEAFRRENLLLPALSSQQTSHIMRSWEPRSRLTEFRQRNKRCPELEQSSTALSLSSGESQKRKSSSDSGNIKENKAMCMFSLQLQFTFAGSRGSLNYKPSPPHLFFCNRQS